MLINNALHHSNIILYFLLVHGLQAVLINTEPDLIFSMILERMP